MSQNARERIIVALDVASAEEAAELILKLRDHVGMFKVGLELLNSCGIGVVKTLRELGGKIFLDVKFNDIPNTVAGASRAVTKLGISMFNVHALAGLETMAAALEASSQEAKIHGVERPLLLGVSILTSIDQKIMNQQLRIPGSVEAEVVHLAALIEQAGLDGIISSPQEIAPIRALSDRLIIVTPGVRPSWAAANDQKRTMSPSEAIRAGASYIVIGRPITKPPANIGGPVDAAELIAAEIEAAFKKVEM